MKQIVLMQKKLYQTHVTKDYQYRLDALKKLEASIRKNEDLLLEALKLDLKKSHEESLLTELWVIYKEFNLIFKQLKSWMKVKKVKTPLLLFRAKSRFMYAPRGVVVIISPWNYPVQLTFLPLLGAIAAGNTVIIKPSEYTPNVSILIKKIIDEIFDDSYICVVNGNKDVVQSLLESQVDYVFFTGSTQVGKIIATKASENLIPFTLELGGKSPCIIDEDVDLKLAAKRICYGKLLNAGQTCIAPDYVIIKSSQVDLFMQYYQEAVTLFYSQDVLHNDSYMPIINETHFKRLYHLLPQEKRDSLVLGHKIYPVIIPNVGLDHPLMQEEIFGPILPLITYETIEEIPALIDKNPNPLALYMFSNNRYHIKYILNCVSFGGGTINDTVMHFMNPHLPFGGIGQSGIGSYHGMHSFITFSHKKSILIKYRKPELTLRYHPLNDKKLKTIKKFYK